MRFFFAVSLMLTLLLPSLAEAEDLPAAFIGTWIKAISPNLKCTRADWTGPAGDERIISVNEREILDYESGCRILGVKVKHAPGGDPSYADAVVDLACGGEGMSSRLQEVWHLGTVEGRKLFTTTSIRQWDYRDDTGRRMKPPFPFEMETSVYLECK